MHGARHHFSPQPHATFLRHHANTYEATLSAEVPLSAAERYMPDMSRFIALPCIVAASCHELRAASRQAASTMDAIGRLLNPEAARMNLDAWVV
jgi:hypothetical protein